ncbi:HNH endonuclease [Glaciihabitans arcticus]|uniref:HNH endonuclease n=1 Tax=Glaciihabitans arcticus TaxID=2668039 RepID=A0A4Q9GSF5_9MICO|nr:HNH endonuclease signature motif containing protein [Glaciihabitans arcticus]TBN57064.1 HNH endonuclease [Glaciihabitans arcticus]
MTFLAPPEQFTPSESLTRGAVERVVSESIDAVIGIDNVIAMLQAQRVTALHQAVVFNALLDDEPGPGSSLRLRSLRAELASATRIPERTAERQLAEAEMLVNSLPATFEALSTAAISERHARVMVDQTSCLDPADIAALEEVALAFAERLTAAQFDRKVRSLREKLHPETMVERRVRAEADREVELCPDRDGMAWLNVYLPAADAVAIFQRLTDLSATVPADPRTLAQRRADAARALLLRGETPGFDPADPGSWAGATHPVPRGVTARVMVTVPALTLLRQSDEPATLEGYGPIDADMARQLTSEAPSLSRLLTHPETGAVLSVGRDSYRIPEVVRNWLRARDGTCRFPGCSQPAMRTEIDHTLGWAEGGGTDHDNLACLCQGHHTLKGETAWSVRQIPASATVAPGTLEWTSPQGRIYRTEPELRLS